MTIRPLSSLSSCGAPILLDEASHGRERRARDTVAPEIAVGESLASEGDVCEVVAREADMDAGRQSVPESEVFAEDDALEISTLREGDRISRGRRIRSQKKSLWRVRGNVREQLGSGPWISYTHTTKLSHTILSKDSVPCEKCFRVQICLEAQKLLHPHQQAHAHGLITFVQSGLDPDSSCKRTNFFTKIDSHRAFVDMVKKEIHTKLAPGIATCLEGKEKTKHTCPAPPCPTSLPSHVRIGSIPMLHEGLQQHS